MYTHTHTHTHTVDVSVTSFLSWSQGPWEPRVMCRSIINVIYNIHVHMCNTLSCMYMYMYIQHASTCTCTCTCTRIHVCNTYISHFRLFYHASLNRTPVRYIHVYMYMCMYTIHVHCTCVCVCAPVCTYTVHVHCTCHVHVCCPARPS